MENDNKNKCNFWHQAICLLEERLACAGAFIKIDVVGN
jgi:hypothetical protein